MEEGTKETHVFEVAETARKAGLSFILILSLLWGVSIFRFYHDRTDHSAWVAWLGLMPAVVLSVFLVVCWVSIRNVSYEVSSDGIIKKRGRKIICSVNRNDIQGFVAKEIITLKAVGQEDFLFRGIGTKSSRKRLLTVLKELGISEIEGEKVNPVQVIIILAAIVCAIHFLVSITMWVDFISLCVKFCRYGIDWLMCLHAVPAAAFFLLSVTTIWFACKRKKGSILLLGLTISASTLCFIFETKNDFYQWDKGKYCTWWWYNLTDKPEESVHEDYSDNHYKYGFIDKVGSIVIEPKYDLADDFSEGLACIGYRIKKEDAPEEIVKRQEWIFDSNSLQSFFGEIEDEVRLYGFVNTKGETVIEPQFDSADAFSDGLARIVIGGNYGYINRNGDIVIEPQFDSRADSFSEGLAAVVIDEKYVFINQRGETAFPEQFDNARRFSEGLAPVKIKEQWGFINRTGQIVIKPQFERATGFSGGLAAVEINDRWGFIDSTGDVVVEPTFGLVAGFYGDIWIVRVDSHWGLVQKWGCIDKTGNIVIEPRFYYPPRFCGDLAYVCYASGWGYRKKHRCEWIDKSGITLNRPNFDKAYVFSEGLAIITVDDRYGFIDQNGTIVIEPQFDTAASFSEGYAIVGLKSANSAEK